MKRTMRMLAFFLAAILTFGCLAACGKESASKTTTNSEFETEEATQTAQPVDETDAQTTDSADMTETSEPADPAVTTTAAAPSDNTDSSTEQAEETTAADKAPQTKEEILALYNESINRVKKESKAVVSNYTRNTQTRQASISNRMLEGIANKLISANMGYDEKKANVTYSTRAQIKDAFPVRGQDWSSRLTAADISKATCTEKDGVYTVTLYLVPDNTPNIKAGQGHAGKAFSIITKESIVEGAGSLGMSVIKEDSIKLTFKDCRIVAKIDKATGRVLSANYYMDWTLALTALGIDVSVSFGSEDDYSVRW